MNGRLPVVICILLTSFVLGCIPITPAVPETPSNVIPVAYIDSISTNRIFRGETIAFSGHGTDTDGTVVAYEWRSSLDGIISTEPGFETSTLSDGKNTIYFRVQDNLGKWSKDVYRDITVIPPGAIAPIINSFTIMPEEIPASGSATISWNVSGADVVSIEPDVGNVDNEGSRTVSPGTDTRYTITATNTAGSISLEKKLTILKNLEITKTLSPISSESGSVLYNGNVEPDPKAGIIRIGVTSQAFLSFDISKITQGSTITSASINISNGTMTGTPYGLLGGLGVFHDKYGTLDTNDFVFGFADPLVTTYVQPFEPFTTRALINAVQKEVDKGSDRFQVRIQFEKIYFYINEANYLDFSQGDPHPQLIIKYTE